MEEIEIEQIEIKEDSSAKIKAVAGLPTKNVVFAREFNSLVKTIKELLKRPTGISDAPQDGVQYVRSNGNWQAASTSEEKKINFQSVIDAGRTVISNYTSDNSYFSFKNNISASRQSDFSVGYNGLIFGVPFNRVNEAFFKQNATALQFGRGNNLLTIGVDTPNIPQGSYLNVGFPAASGIVAVVNTTAPASPTANGRIGEIRVTDTHVYYCIATNTWRRMAFEETWHN
ncbi:hypothetical protein [Flavobacterium columnare]|uniref:Uncharacterized protein n=1 Tax=Flavobacterium columnare TaxID=996 RepID=A0AAI8CG02_9FLAO|nr:hypothetical protein [Flavobacterium columnare]AMO19403.1 hypothetical protein UN65_02720 [Flavobacterium columnare]AUX17339.1 hypothetical protein AQ623_02810 [Flavobacterium columnare]QOG56359.1 hypothetical protein HUE29_02750 [Flavobacterium columnare]QOG59083.1 hypothetical protein HUE30_02755 [Flavobacterium columnare]QOG61804.1 hypothetical protein HUE31_02755 [Flavobacterium columnare]